MTAADQVQSAIAIDGFGILEGVLSSDRIHTLLTALAHVDEGESVRKRGGVFAVRSLLETCPEIAELAGSDEVRACVQPVLGPEFFPVRGTLFDKIPGANWKVPWHQDLTIAVAERIEVAGWGPWSVKAGIQHVQPSAEVLENMLTVRLHLDTCSQNNGGAPCAARFAPSRAHPGEGNRGPASIRTPARVRRRTRRSALDAPLAAPCVVSGPRAGASPGGSSRFRCKSPAGRPALAPATFALNVRNDLYNRVNGT